MPPRAQAGVGGQNPEFVLREFEGMNTLAAREAINDNEFWWCENAIPIAAGKVLPVSGAAQLSTVAEATSPTYTCNFNVSGVTYALVVFASSGNGYILTVATGVWTKVFTGTLTSGQTFATPYNNQGLLIVDPTGYWDYAVTTPGVLTVQNNAVASITNGIMNRLPGGVSVFLTASGLAGAGAMLQPVYEVVFVNLVNAGTGYAVGDTINLTDNNPTLPAQIIVATITGGGATGPIGTITLPTGGSYPGPIYTSGATSPAATTGPSGTVTTTTGGGTGVAVAVKIQPTAMNILARGSGYALGGTLVDNYGDTWTVVPSGVISGTSIATYDGRVWISYLRTVNFTDIDSYVSFGGVGGSFTIPDAYLVANITALYAANNYLYIFGDTSIDALSNVTVAAGVTSFSRINVTGSVGCSLASSIFSYYRGIVFYHASGIYLLSGSTPEKISEKISGIIAAAVGTQVYGGTVLVAGELCAVVQLVINDDFAQTATVTRPLFVLFFRGRWWVYSFPFTAGFYTTASFTYAAAGIATLAAFRCTGALTAYYRCFSPAVALPWLLRTKLWDAGAPLHEKQSMNAAIAGQFQGINPTGVIINVDTETATTPTRPIDVPSDGYALEVTLSTEGGSQYLGLTVTGSTDMTQIDLLALRGKQDRNMLAG
jgi:hypothetical protein